MNATVDRPWYEIAFGAHYPHVYAHRDEVDARRCLDLLPRLAPLGPGPVVDLGCGQGRHLAMLRGRGVPAVGIDLSRPLLDLARNADPALALVRADMRRLPVRSGSCSAVLSLFTAFGYFGPAAAHEPVVAEVARVLGASGHWFLDFLDSERVATELASGARTRERTLGALLVREQRQLADAPRRVVKTVDVSARAGCEPAAAAAGIGPAGLRYREEVTLLGLAELDELAGAAGLRRVAAAGDYAGAPLVPGESERWLLVYGRSERCGVTW
ncbi:MAG TPA: class I SAM-dependent methyltransferase [Candidatus Krumholzibacteria bacterium]|nr:class I SAM-dependent methyltransferase [Candidatus Krumholzibacteria bacterium]HPD71689.1 class I SAM-dependent methyltransferase [Candidatus Krumholzibacteria bacterium]HRY41378.1 class I SAM-dependent methyltransferase [Candidatus Krumholzibacteria bacterium]